jgi:DNA-binding transcriptional MocR family regulator
MHLPMDAHSRTSIRRPVAEPFANVIEGAGRPRGAVLASIQELAGSSGINSNPVTRAIEDLKRSGYRPLRPRPAPLQPSSTPRPARHAVDSDTDGMPGQS